MKIIKFPELKQTTDYDCGATALTAVLAYFGINVAEKDIMQAAKTTKFGTPIVGLKKVVKKYGLKYQAGEMTAEQVKRYIDKKIPVILLIQAWTDKDSVAWQKDWTDGHYAVAIGYDKTKMYFEDPWTTLRTYLTYKELAKRWHDVDKHGKKYLNFGLAVYGKKSSYDLHKTIHMD